MNNIGTSRSALQKNIYLCFMSSIVSLLIEIQLRIEIKIKTSAFFPVTFDQNFDFPRIPEELPGC